MKLIFMIMQLPIFKELEDKIPCSINHGFKKKKFNFCVYFGKDKNLVLIILLMLRMLTFFLRN